MWKVETNGGPGQGWPTVKSWEEDKGGDDDDEEATNFTNYFFCLRIRDLTTLLYFGKFNCNLLGYSNRVTCPA